MKKVEKLTISYEEIQMPVELKITEKLDIICRSIQDAEDGHREYAYPKQEQDLETTNNDKTSTISNSSPDVNSQC